MTGLVWFGFGWQWPAVGRWVVGGAEARERERERSPFAQMNGPLMNGPLKTGALSLSFARQMQSANDKEVVQLIKRPFLICSFATIATIDRSLSLSLTNTLLLSSPQNERCFFSALDPNKQYLSYAKGAAKIDFETLFASK